MGNKRFRIAAFEIAAIFFLCFLYGFWPVPDVNEPYYVGKAIHFWNRGLFPNDPFLNAPDSHWLFFAVFGFFSLFLKPAALVWFGRVTIWLLTAVGWQRLSNTLIPRRGWSILTAAAFLFYLENFHLAGEWVIGGVEGKGFAFPFLFLGLSMFLRRRYGLAYLFMGLASAFHVLVGGWGVLASLGALLYSALSEQLHRVPGETESEGSRIKPLAAGLLFGGLIALIGILPALALDRGVTPEIEHKAHAIYVYERLAHHLVPSSLPWIFRVRFFLLALVWFFLCRFRPHADVKSARNPSEAWTRWNSFVGVSLVIAAVGLFWDYGIPFLVQKGCLADDHLAADMLRFYWFRLSDWAVPAGVALGGTMGLASLAEQKNTELSPVASRRFQVWLVLIFSGSILFTAVKKGFLIHSIAVAHKATVSPFFPVPPRPVNALAFLTAVLLFAAAGCLLRRLRTRSVSVFAARIPLFLLSTLTLLAPIWGAAQMLEMKTGVLVPRSNPPKESISNAWLEVCRWAKENTPSDAVFLAPRGYESWKWNANRREVGNWKEMPQDAASIVKWYAMMEDLYTTGTKKGKDRWNDPLIGVLIAKGENRIAKQAEKYHIDYIVAEQPPYNLAVVPKAKERFDAMIENRKVWQNGHFIVFRFGSDQSAE